LIDLDIEATGERAYRQPPYGGRRGHHLGMAVAKAIGDKTIAKITSTLKSEPLSLLELDGFYWRRDWCELDKTVFNVTPCFNPFEKHFAQFLEHAGDIQRFAKLAESYTKFSIEYLNHKGALSVYYPDFVAAQERKDKKTVMWLIETKGWEQADVPLKDAALWNGVLTRQD